MKKIEMYYLKACPFCKKAFGFMDELKKENPEYNKIEIELVEEEEQKERADALDYYFVPTYYIEGKKIHEGIINKDGVKTVLDKALI